MKIYFVRSLVILTSIFTLIASAAECAPADIAEQWGLIGSWAVNCRRPPARNNAYYSYVRRADALVVVRDLGSFSDENEVTAAEVAPDGGIDLVVEFKAFSHVMTSRLVRDAAGQIHTLSNKDETGAYTIRNGRLTKTGSPGAVMKRCAKADAA